MFGVLASRGEIVALVKPQFEVVGVGWDFPDRFGRAVEAVTAADVAQAAERYLTGPTVVVLQPTTPKR